MRIIVMNGQRLKGTSKKSGKDYDFSNLECVWKEGAEMKAQAVTVDPSVLDAASYKADNCFPMVADFVFGFGGRIVHIDVCDMGNEATASQLNDWLLG